MNHQHILEKLGISQLNEMQEAVLKASETNNEIVLLSPTGSGKTLGFLLPLLESLREDKQGVQALIITPTRELAIQIESVFRKMGTSFKINATYGGHSIRVEQNNFSELPAVLVGTPGRIVDHLNRRNLELSTVATLVLDEFDKSLEMGFQEDMEIIIKRLSAVKKRFLTSATDIGTIPEFTGLNKPFRLEFLKQTENRLKVFRVYSPDTDKLYTLLDLLCACPHERTLIFCNHREVVERVGEFLDKSGIDNVMFHGGLEQDERERALIKFRNGSAGYMVTTDLAARGLDIPETGNVIHYQLPLNEDAWIHRNGRTARQSASGNAYILLTEKDQLPSHMDKDFEVLKPVNENGLPPKPEFVTIYFSAGKKDKVNKIDLVGFLSKIGGLKPQEIGLIAVLDYTSFVAVSARRQPQLMAKIRNEKVKGKKLKIAVAR